MSGKSLKEQAFIGIGWSAVERFSVQGITFLVQLVLARLLTPSDFGVIGMLAIFLQVAQVFIDSGFANALIQKQDCNEVDFSTVFYYNLCVSVLLYVVLFFSAPYVALFYSAGQITSVLRVLALVLIFNALSIVQKTKLVKAIDFKKQSKVTLFSSVISGTIGIFLAYKGFGVWALVAQQLINSIAQLILYVHTVRWVPTLNFSANSFRFVFNFGSKLMVSSLIGVIYKNLYSIIIGRKFSAYDLGLYTRAEGFAIFPSNNISAIITRASYPVMSKLQNNDTQLLNCYKQLIQYSSFVIFPLMCGLIAVSKPFILVFLTDKWIESVPLLQILSISWMFDHLCSINLNLLYVKGRTDLVLKLEIVKKTIAIAILFISMPFGLIAMCWGLVLYTFVAVFINTIYTKRLFGYGWLQQFTDYLPYLIAASIMLLIVYEATLLFENPIIQLLAGITIGISLYTLLSLIFFKKQVSEIRRLIIKK